MTTEKDWIEVRGQGSRHMHHLIMFNLIDTSQEIPKTEF